MSGSPSSSPFQTPPQTRSWPVPSPRPRSASQSPSPGLSLVAAPRAGLAAVFQPFRSRFIRCGVTVNGQAVTTLADVRQHLIGLSTNEVVDVLRNIQDQIRDNAETLQDLGYDLWQMMQDREDLQARRSRDAHRFNQEFSVIREAHNQARTRRNRIAEAQNRLTREWMSQAFLTTVVLEQTSGSSQVLDELVRVRAFGTPSQLMARASAFRLQRLARVGPYMSYATHDTIITPQDIRHAANQTLQVPFSPADEAAAATAHRLIPDARGIHWINGVQPPEIDIAYARGGRGVAAIPGSPVQTIPASPPPAATPRKQLLDPSTPVRPSSGSASPTSGRSIEKDVTQPELRRQTRGTDQGQPATTQQQSKRPLSEVSPSPPPERGAQPTWIKYDKLSSPLGSPQRGREPSDVHELISKLHTLSLSPTMTPIDPKKVKPVKNPVQQPSQLEAALWTHALGKVRAIAERRPPPALTIGQKEAIADAVLNITNLYSSLNRMSSAVQGILNSDVDNLRAYLEGLADGGAIAFTGHEINRHNVGGVRELAHRFRVGFDGGDAQVGNGNQNEQGMRISPHDFETLIHDEQHNGWLNDAVLAAALRGIARSSGSTSFVVDIPQMTLLRQRLIPPEEVRMPSRPMNLVIPIHWGNHWTVGLVDIRNRVIHHMDSLHERSRHRQGINMIYALIAAQNPSWVTDGWTSGTIRSGQQRNTYDCGLWVIENARRLMEANDYTTPVGPATRRYIAQELHARLILDTPPLTEHTRRQLEITRAQQVVANASGPGRSISSPIRIGTPGPDMPYLPNAPSPPPWTSRTPRAAIPESSSQGNQGSQQSTPSRQLGRTSPTRGRQRHSTPPTSQSAPASPHQGAARPRVRGPPTSRRGAQGGPGSGSRGGASNGGNNGKSGGANHQTRSGREF